MKGHQMINDEENGVDKSASEKSDHEVSRRKLMKKLATGAFAAPVALVTLTAKASNIIPA